MRTLVFILSLTAFQTLSAQLYDDYLGAGQDQGITVTTSSDSRGTVGQNTINGAGMDAARMDAARFLVQASFGGNMDEVNALAETNNYDGWIDQQFNTPASLLLPRLWAVDARARELFAIERPGEEYFGPFSIHFNYAWWDQIKKAPDQLRQRVAFALSQIFVISMQSGLGDYGEAVSSYYDVLINNAFGNYKDLMMEVSLHPCMGFYLSHMNNPRADTINNIHPDENYAREIMQLFSIGLYELHLDGTRKTSGGEWIATYDNEDIRGLAKVFTGLGMGAWAQWVIDEYGNIPIEFGQDLYAIDRTVPMTMFEEQHEPGSKTIIGNYTIPSGQTGMEDIEEAVDHIFNHPNVGPFVSLRLIQSLIKSNPTPAYVARVATVFNDNGSGVRGDMKAVVRAILMDDEARNCDAQADPGHGKLREPVIRSTQVLRGLPMDSPTGDYWNNAFDYYEDTKQIPMNAPSVFNFFLPDHQPVGDFNDAGLFGPEYQIHNSQTSIGYVNQANKWAVWNVMFWDWIGESPEGDDLTPNVDVVLDELIELADDPEEVINRLDILFTHGQLSDTTRSIIRDAMDPMDWNGAEIWRVRMALYLILISPDYAVLK